MSRRCKERKEQIKFDSNLANVYRNAKTSDGSLIILANGLTPMPERKITYEFKSNPSFKKLNQRFKSFALK